MARRRPIVSCVDEPYPPTCEKEFYHSSVPVVPHKAVSEVSKIGNL